jgi:hypothetical protein
VVRFLAGADLWNITNVTAFPVFPGQTTFDRFRSIASFCSQHLPKLCIPALKLAAVLGFRTALKVGSVAMESADAN